KFDQLCRSIWSFRVHAHPSSKRNIGLYLRRERADELDTGRRQNLSDDDHAKLDLALGDKLGNNVGLWSSNFQLDSLRNPEALEQAMQINAAADPEIGDRFRVEQCALKRFDRTDIGLTRAGAHFHSDSRARNVRACPRDQLALFDPLVDRSADQDVQRI